VFYNLCLLTLTGIPPHLQLMTQFLFPSRPNGKRETEGRRGLQGALYTKSIIILIIIIIIYCPEVSRYSVLFSFLSLPSYCTHIFFSQPRSFSCLGRSKESIKVRVPLQYCSILVYLPQICLLRHWIIKMDDYSLSSVTIVNMWWPCYKPLPNFSV
jgi:hypothetical protein